jgi:hypothetical protein
MRVAAGNEKKKNIKPEGVEHCSTTLVCLGLKRTYIEPAHADYSLLKLVNVHS